MQLVLLSYSHLRQSESQLRYSRKIRDAGCPGTDNNNNAERAMLRYQSTRHRRLMQESEQALEDAASGSSARAARIASQVLADKRTHSLWEARHAELLRPVAEERRRTPQILAMRRVETGLVHQTALIDYIRRKQIRGRLRQRLFEAFYGPREFTDAILIEHRNYVLATSSALSTDHLIDIMHDSTSTELLGVYRKAFAAYFSMYCYFNCSRDRIMADAIKASMQDARQRVEGLRQQLYSVKPEAGHSDFDQQAALARSGRYPVINYMNR